MTHTLKIATLRTLSVPAALAAAVLLAGCDKMEAGLRQGDRKVETALMKADASRADGGEKAADKTIADLKQAAAVSDAGPGGQVQAKSELGREEYERAIARLPEIQHRSQQVALALGALDSAGLQIQAIQTTNAGYAKLEPKESLDQVEASRGEAAKALEKAKADGAAAQGELDKRQKEIDDLKGQRTAAEGEAEQLAQKSGDAKGKESVDLFRQSTEARTKAGTLAAQIESKTAALLPFQRTVAIAKQQQDFWDNQAKDAPGALQQIDERKTQVQSGWQETQSQIQAMTGVAKKILTETITPKADAPKGDLPAHMNPGAMVVKLSEENAARRDEVAKDLEDAIKNYDGAAMAAKKVRDDVVARQGALSAKNPADKYAEAFKTLASLYDENNYLLGKGRAEMALANLRADAARDLQMRAATNDRLAKTLQASGLQLPAELSKGAAASDAQKAVADADAAYQAAEKTLGDVAETTRNTEDATINRNAGLAGLIGAHYARYMLTGSDDAKKALTTDIAKAGEAQVDVPAAIKNLK